MMLHIKDLVVSDKIFFMFSYLTSVNHVTTGAGHFFFCPRGII